MVFLALLLIVAGCQDIETDTFENQTNDTEEEIITSEPVLSHSVVTNTSKEVDEVSIEVIEKLF